MNGGERLPGTPAPMHLWPTDEGLRVAADAWGDPAAPLVLLGHGGGQTRHAWRKTAQDLGAAGYHAVAFDLRGHGDSDWPPDGAYGIDAYVAGLQSLLRALGGRKPVLIGASLSAQIFLIAAGEGAVDAAALVMVHEGAVALVSLLLGARRVIGGAHRRFRLTGGGGRGDQQPPRWWPQAAQPRWAGEGRAQRAGRALPLALGPPHARLARTRVPDAP